MTRLLVLSLCLVARLALADPQCTTEDTSTWKNADAFKASLIEKGYRIKVFKTTKTNCYELYGWDPSGKKVEIYFNPVTGAVVKEKKQ
ncbi:MAG: PepSY domain-containing protein [Archangium sp.]|nr:PepSY domain-containing protein [Archangium sp.]